MTNYTTLISAEQLQALTKSGQPLRIFDCSFDLMQPHAGMQNYLKSHIPGAIYADLETALTARHGVPGAHGLITASGADAPASGGRHPLPNREKFATWLSSVGMGNEMQAVVYDCNQANYCGRLWWMLKWAGHENVAMLDGGLQAWQAAGGAVNSGEEPGHFQTNFLTGPERALLVDAQTIVSQLGRPTQTLIDARATPRFKGEIEPLDPVAGHIPGALNRPFGLNLMPDGKFKPADQLKAEFMALLGQRDPASVVHHCGSGVSALPNLVAMEIAGLGRTALYAGSWSDWCKDPERAVAQG
ncbi:MULTISPECIES: sulfurtransferase [unclassified Polaromonas]|uniref:sulfurtransferase n=1 Tax=unclassified Polaromonas TaxID=2638319 RepID=UPI0018CA5A7F|nr:MULTISPECIES: sulfurtransferase [unclassified Polaromonas]MBG6071732.1 thiosulfate/3-mercaptopyruvate sulfurtransferase [Polaromonas sp. CG_9.7]MBG6113733.1 thiosulfate/3-mercaptopyruvate sulfurtransferase [Polaromonas sp. CG_9.2]MDH6184366.1 thiosulfate/3-mercaptopyruvate sulfurtransferase [Polaromonas sp. CG_23.6]